MTGISFCGSTDHGATWNVQHSADPTFDGGVWFSDTLHGWTGGGEISPSVAGWVHRTTDGGASWSPGNSGLAADANVSSLAVDPADAQLVYAGTTNHGILRSTDGGQTWARMDGGLRKARGRRRGKVE